MRRRLTKNLSLKLVSVLIAFLIWLIVANINNPTTTKLFRDIKIQLVNENSVAEIDKAFDILSEDSVTISVTERRQVVDGLSSSDFTVIADMENLTEMNTVPLMVTCSDPAVTLDEMTVVPSSLKVELEQIVQGDFVVTVETTGTPLDGYEIGETRIQEGKSVQIAGPESLVDQIGSVSAEVSVNRISSDLKQTVSLAVYDKNGDSFSETQMSRLQIRDASGALLPDGSVTVEADLWKVITDVPIQVETTGEPMSGYEVTGVTLLPETVSIAGDPDALDTFGGVASISEPISVEGASESFTREIDLNEALTQVENVRLAQNVDSLVTVTVTIEKDDIQVLQIPLSDLHVLNRPESMTLTFLPADAITVTVNSDEEDGILDGEDVSATVDLSECAEAGDHEIPVEIELPEGYTLVSEVVLTVNSAEQEQIEASTEE